MGRFNINPVKCTVITYVTFALHRGNTLFILASTAFMSSIIALDFFGYSGKKKVFFQIKIKIHLQVQPERR